MLIDQETIYVPRHGNDRLLLGLKGSLNEYELDLLRQRSLSARYEKARRGELVVSAPVALERSEGLLLVRPHQPRIFHDISTEDGGQPPLYPFLGQSPAP